MVERRQFASSSSSDTYEVQYDRASGRASCTCPGWIYSRNAKGCKHTRIVLAELGDGSTPPPTVPPTREPVDALGEPKFKPMLASARKADVPFAFYENDRHVMEPKLDGERKMFRVVHGLAVTAWSRPQAGKEPLDYSLPEYLRTELVQLPSAVYDGEVYVGGRGRRTSTDVGALLYANDLHIALFDIVEVNGTNVTDRPYHERREGLMMAIAHIEGAERVSVVPQFPVSMATVTKLWDLGGEGAIIKRLDAPYRFGWRTPDWIKVKRSGTEVVTIIGFERGKAASSTPWSVVRFRQDSGKEGTCGTLDNATVEDVAKNPAKYIGRRLVISYIEKTPSGSFKSGGWDHVLWEQPSEKSTA
jgi:ATP dependent DNA ligase domain